MGALSSCGVARRREASSRAPSKDPGSRSLEATQTSPSLQRLAQGGELEHQPPSRGQFVTLVRLGRSLLEDAGRDSLSLEGRFSLVYGAAQALSDAALRAQGYRS